MMPTTALPYVDEHETVVEAAAEDVWRSLTTVVDGSFALEGGHRFSSYALIFRLAPAGPGRSRLTAETRATFPGLAGGLYRRAVIGSGGHAIGIRRLLAAVRRRATRP